MQISIKELIKELATIRSLILFICILVLIKIRDYSSHLTYLDGNEVTAKVGFRIMKRSTQLALGVYPGHSKILDNIEYLDEKLDHFIGTNIPYQMLMLGFVFNETRVRARRVLGQGPFFDKQGVDIGRLIARLRIECEKFWETYYWEEYAWNRDYIDNIWHLDQNKIRYYMQLNDIASESFEKSMKTVNDAMAKRHWQVLLELVDLAGSPTEDEKKAGFEAKKLYSKDENDKNFYKHEFFWVYEKIFKVDCYFERKDAIPYSLMGKWDWGFGHGGLNSGMEK